MRRVVEQEHVEIAVAVVVEEQRLCRISDVIESVLLRAIGERAVTVVDVQHVPSVHGEVIDGGDINVDVTVPVHVRHRNAGFPANGIRHAGVIGDILESIIAPVQVKAI